MSSGNEKFKIDYFSIQVGAWRILGALDLSNGKYLGWAMFLNVFVSMLVPMLLLSLFSFETPLENITNVSLTITSLSTILKFGMYVRKLHKLVEMKEVIAQLDSRAKGKEQIRYHRHMAKYLQRLSRVFLATFLTVMVNTAISFLFRSERSLPFPLWIPFDWKHSMVAYVAVLLFQEVGIFCQVLQNFADDSFPPLALYLISEQCHLLILRISSIGYGSASQRDNEKDLVNCIKDQNDLYRLLELTRSLITGPMLIQFIVIAANIALIMFGLVFYVERVQDRVFYMTFLWGVTLQTYPLCYYGTMMADSFSSLHYAIFCSNWIDQSSRYRSNMLILAERTKQQQLLLAGDILPIHLSTFAAICKGAYSFFTLMYDSVDKIQNLNKP
ncbi:odorant receptor 23a [Drosophila serrata]|uniref:odorant receptor 23a n=1 Tax=Drosophila serrata TaxID=7274 RepID=UPI000A1D0721|nr:odorant receptor 23a [Drosophila serrata]